MAVGEFSPFVYRRRVEFADTDIAGIAHFASLFCYMEEAEHAFLRSRELSVFPKEAGRVVSWPRLSAKCDFLSPCRFEETIEIAVHVQKIERKTVTFCFEMSIGARPVAKGEFVTICCEVGGSEPIRSIEIPADIVARLS